MQNQTFLSFLQCSKINTLSTIPLTWTPTPIHSWPWTPILPSIHDTEHPHSLLHDPEHPLPLIHDPEHPFSHPFMTLNAHSYPWRVREWIFRSEDGEWVFTSKDGVTVQVGGWGSVFRLKDGGVCSGWMIGECVQVGGWGSVFRLEDGGVCSSWRMGECVQVEGWCPEHTPPSSNLNSNSILWPEHPLPLPLTWTPTPPSSDLNTSLPHPPTWTPTHPPTWKSTPSTNHPQPTHLPSWPPTHHSKHWQGILTVQGSRSPQQRLRSLCEDWYIPPEPSTAGYSPLSSLTFPPPHWCMGGSIQQ